MIRTLLPLLLVTQLFATSSEDLSFSYAEEQIPKKSVVSKKDSLYTLQILSVKTLKTANEKLKRLPKNLKKDTHLYQVGNYIAARYSQAQQADKLFPRIEEFKKYGFLDAYVLKSSSWHMQSQKIDEKGTAKVKKIVQTQEKEKDKPQQQKSESKTSLTIQNTTKISKFVKSSMLLKAAKAYKEGDESTAMLYYEMLLNSGYSTQKIRNNLVYLYGKRGAWDEAKKIIDKERYTSKLLYAYAYGEIETNQDSFLEHMSQDILIDKSGRLALLAGHYFEQRQDIERAASFFKMSYSKNPSDLYNIFAYARSLDIQENYTEALTQYTKILIRVNKNHKNYAQVERRVLELRR